MSMSPSEGSHLPTTTTTIDTMEECCQQGEVKVESALKGAECVMFLAEGGKADPLINEVGQDDVANAPPPNYRSILTPTLPAAVTKWVPVVPHSSSMHLVVSTPVSSAPQLVDSQMVVSLKKEESTEIDSAHAEERGIGIPSAGPLAAGKRQFAHGRGGDGKEPHTAQAVRRSKRRRVDRNRNTKEGASTAEKSYIDDNEDEEAEERQRRSDAKASRTGRPHRHHHHHHHSSSSPAGAIASTSALLTPRRSTIGVGSRHQAIDIVPLEEFLPPQPTSQRPSAEAERDECQWRPFPSSMCDQQAGDRLIDAKSWEEYCSVARRQCGMGIDEALRCAFLNNYSLPQALAHLEEVETRAHRPGSRSRRWSVDEEEAFNRQLNTGRKLFAKVAKVLSSAGGVGGNKKSTADVVEHYYAVKKGRCPTSTRFLTCPYRARAACENCTKYIWKHPSSHKLAKLGRRKGALCLACELHLKPFTVPPPSVKGALDPLQPASPSPSPIPQSQHAADCFFEPRLDQLRSGSGNMAGWSYDMRLECVKGFHRHGKDFGAIAKELPLTNAGGGGCEMASSAWHVEQFYHDQRLHYTLDRLIEAHDAATTAAATTTTTGKCDSVSTSNQFPPRPLLTTTTTTSTSTIASSHHPNKTSSSSTTTSSSKVLATGGGGRKLIRVLQQQQQQRTNTLHERRIESLMEEDAAAAASARHNNPREPVGCAWSSMVTRNQRARRVHGRREGGAGNEEGE